jgi:hypothetical protein
MKKILMVILPLVTGLQVTLAQKPASTTNQSNRQGTTTRTIQTKPNNVSLPEDDGSVKNKMKVNNQVQTKPNNVSLPEDDGSVKNKMKVNNQVQTKPVNINQRVKPVQTNNTAPAQNNNVQKKNKVTSSTHQ